MIIVLASFLIITVLVSWYWILTTSSAGGIQIKKAIRKGSGYLAIWNVLVSVCLLASIAGSYFSYLEARTFYSATVEQYASAIEMYGDKAVLNVEAAAWTDLKYQGYQKNIADFIKTLREKVTGYNKRIIGKRIMDANPIFSWLIIMPDDDMKIIKLRTASQHIK